MLQHVLLKQGEKAAHAATHAIIAYAQQEHERYPQEYHTLPRKRKRKTQHSPVTF